MEDKTPKNTFTIAPDTEKNKPDAYYRLLNAKGTNALVSVPSTVKRAKLLFRPFDEKDPDSPLSLFGPDDVNIELSSASGATLLGQTKKFYCYLIKKFTEKTPHDISNFDINKKENREVPFDVEDYLQTTGKEITTDSGKNIIRKIKKYVDVLTQARVIFDEINPKTQRIKHYEFLPLSGKGYEGDIMTRRGRKYFIVLNKDAVSYLLDGNYITNIPAALWHTADVDFPSAFSIGYELSIFYSMNRGKTNQGIVSVRSLLERISDIPKPDELKDDPHITDRLIKPLDDSLDHLQEIGVLEQWEWANKNKEPITDEQFRQFIDKPKGVLAAFLELYLIYKMKDYPVDEIKVLEPPKKKKKAPKKV